MPSKYHESVWQTVEDLLRAGVSPTDVYKDLQISSTWVYNLRQLIQTFGTATPPHPSVQGRPRKIYAEAEDGILDFLDDNPTTYLDEI
jgi:transposase